MTRTQRTRLGRDTGSIPLALLVIISLTGIIGALVVTTVGSARAARFDQQYTEVIQVADTGAQEGAQLLLRSMTVQQLSQAPSPMTGSGDLGGIPYTWVAERVDAVTWRVTSTAETAEVDRTVVIELVGQPRFSFAAFSDNVVTFRGSNQARSYGGPDPGPNGTGGGIIASNGTVTINGNSSNLDGVHLYDWEANEDFNRCRHSGGSGCNDVLNTPDATPPSARIDEPLLIGPGQTLDTKFIADQLREGHCDPDPPVDYTASTYDGGAGVGRLGTDGDITVLCFANATFDRNVDIHGHVEIYVYGDLRFSNGVRVNCNNPSCPDTPWASENHMPESSRLQFFVSGVDLSGGGTDVAIGNHSRIAAGIYAPESHCGGNPSNAQASVYGSLVCGSISNQGGWNFFYDDRLGSASISNFDMRRWNER